MFKKIASQVEAAKFEASKFLKNEDGATAIEYGLIAAGIAVAIVVAVFAVGEDLQTMFDDVGTELEKRPN